MPKFMLKRDEDGNLIPISGVSPNLMMKIKVLPLTLGQSKQYESWGDGVLDWTVEEKCQLLNDHLVEVDGEEFPDDLEPQDFMQNFDAWTADDLILGVAMTSGLHRLYESAEGKELQEALEQMGMTT